nr:ras-related protein Rab-7a-like [Penaeus vannamei]
MKRSKEKFVLKTRKSVEEDEVPKRNDKCKRDRESEKGTPSTMKESKLVILGAGGVGKTSLVLQFLQGFFSTTYKPTVEDCYSHTLQLPNGLFHALEILDTAGSHHFPAMRELSIRSGRAFVIVFAVNNEQSFYEAQSLWNLITKIKGLGDPRKTFGDPRRNVWRPHGKRLVTPRKTFGDPRKNVWRPHGKRLAPPGETLHDPKKNVWRSQEKRLVTPGETFHDPRRNATPGKTLVDPIKNVSRPHGKRLTTPDLEKGNSKIK